MVHSKILEETALWKNYQEKVTGERDRSNWVKEVCEAASNYMKDVRLTFQNYTLHDETHIINVLDAIGGLLGNQISQLTAGEMELLLLAASLHDLGMVYTKEEKTRHYNDEEACGKFLREYCPEFLGCPVEDWPEDIRQWYLRTLHPFRVAEVLQNETWKELFARCPKEVVPKRCVLAVCKAHGENQEALLHNNNLKYLAANNADPLFCALLLRLGDLLDFDDTRAPKILYSYVTCNEESRGEWDKHQASAGFRYPDTPSTNDLPYKACCTNPGVEHAVRDFLDWVDDELGNCMRLQKYCNAGWQQQFAFPRAVSRKEIESEGYMSGDFCLTMDQTQVLKLLSGENLYDNNDVFVRELLQNAIDATLLRGKMDRNFVPEESRIDFWEWNDKDGNVWFRIDDQGTGMTLGMLQRYFLKVGNSYYTSRELDRDLRDHDQTERYTGISRFGIGFLSCFLCGDYTEVSTLYFDPGKNRREESVAESYQTVHYGLRLQVTGLSGYYTLKNQAEDHQADERMPIWDGYDTGRQCSYERDGYRAKAGTSIAIRLNPGKLGTLNLRDTVEKYLFGARVPVYYNNERIGRTYEEVMRAAHELAGERIYELTDKMKEQFDKTFPAVRGQYPKIAMTVVPLDTEEDQILSGVSGVLAKYEVQFDKTPEWEVDDQKYIVEGELVIRNDTLWMALQSNNIGKKRLGIKNWKTIKKEFGESVGDLEREFKRYSRCPKKEQLGKVWFPFAECLSLYETWISYLNYQQKRFIQFSFEECGCPNVNIPIFNDYDSQLQCVYQGVVAGKMRDQWDEKCVNIGVFFLENECRPVTEVSRVEIKGFPLMVLVVIAGILRKYQMNIIHKLDYSFITDYVSRSLKKWREVQTSHLKQWMNINYKNLFMKRIQILKQSMKSSDFNLYYRYLSNKSGYTILNMFHKAYLQDNYQMMINYEEGQTISVFEKDEVGSESILDLFPPMMFCRAASDRSRRYICSADMWCRKGITMDHPFVVWLLNNADLLNQYYQRQFLQIIDCLCNEDAEDIIQECNDIRQQLMSLLEHHGVDVRNFPQLSMDDFWSMDDLEDKID